MKSDLKSPWPKVERDLFKKALSKDKTLKMRLKELGIKTDKEPDIDIISEQVRASLKVPIKTYLQELDEEYIVKEPIEVICTIDEDNIVSANALKLGLLQNGEGENIEEALDELANLIIDQKKFFDQEDENNIYGYAALVKNRFDQFINKLK